MPTADQRHATELLKALIASFEQIATSQSDAQPFFNGEAVLFKPFHEAACHWLIGTDPRYSTFLAHGYVVLTNGKTCVQSIQHAIELNRRSLPPHSVTDPFPRQFGTSLASPSVSAAPPATPAENPNDPFASLTSTLMHLTAAASSASVATPVRSSCTTPAPAPASSASAPTAPESGMPAALKDTMVVSPEHLDSVAQEIGRKLLSCCRDFEYASRLKTDTGGDGTEILRIWQRIREAHDATTDNDETILLCMDMYYRNGLSGRDVSALNRLVSVQ